MDASKAVSQDPAVQVLLGAFCAANQKASGAALQSRQNFLTPGNTDFLAKIGVTTKSMPGFHPKGPDLQKKGIQKGFKVLQR
jgi:hypothetical protein